MADDSAMVSSSPAWGFVVVFMRAHNDMRPRAALVDARGGRSGSANTIDRRLALRPHLRVAEKQPAPMCRLAPALEGAPIDERPPVKVVVEVARENEAVHQRRVKEQLLKTLQRTEPDEIPAAEADQVLAHVEAPVLPRRVGVPDDF